MCIFKLKWRTKKYFYIIFKMEMEDKTYGINFEVAITN
jgi:hypothetical protein